MRNKRRRGRPSKLHLPRSASGRIKKAHRETAGETEMQAMSTVLEYRRRAGVAEKDLRRSEAGYELGRLYLRGVISARHHEAGKQYACLVADYQRQVGFPAPYPSAMDFNAVRGLALAEEPEAARVRRTANQYMRSQTALSDAGKAGFQAVTEVCIYDRDTAHIESLRLGLAALAQFFGIPVDEDAEEKKRRNGS